MRKAVIWIGVFVVLGLVGHVLNGDGRFGLRQPKQRPFFRLKVGLTYKDKPVDIDIVVGCSVHSSWSRASGGSTFEVTGMSAYWFATSMPDGHAIAIRTVPAVNIGPCQGDTTANRGVGAHWLPLIVWYERDDDFVHGVGYVSQMAYQNPNARFGFRGAVIEHADQSDYDRFVATGRKNLWPPYFSGAMSGGRRRVSITDVRMDELVENPRKAWPYSYRIGCKGARRVRLDENQRAKVRATWPANHPRFWNYKTWREQSDAWHKLLTEYQREDVAGSFYPEGSDRNGDHLLELYPTLADYTLGELNPKTPGDNRYVEHILIDPALRGFEYCDYPAPPELIRAVTHKPASELRAFITCQIGDDIIADSQGCHTFQIAFENDEYAIIPEDPIQ